jgi:hypothetical protein
MTHRLRFRSGGARCSRQHSLHVRPGAQRGSLRQPVAPFQSGIGAIRGGPVGAPRGGRAVPLNTIGRPANGLGPKEVAASVNLLTPAILDYAMRIGYSFAPFLDEVRSPPL